MKTARLLLLVAVSVAPAVGQSAKEPSFYGGVQDVRVFPTPLLSR